MKLSDGQTQTWHVATRKDLNRLLNSSKLGSAAILDKSCEPPVLFLDPEYLQDGQLYHKQSARHSSPVRKNLTLWLPAEEGGHYVKGILPAVTQAQFAQLLATFNLVGVRAPNEPEELAELDISLLKDNADYYGVSTETSCLTFAVKRLERIDNKLEEGDEDVLRERLHRLAMEEFPSSSAKAICRKVYSKRGRDVVEIDAAMTVHRPSQPPIAYIAVRKRTLTLEAFDEVESKWLSIKAYRKDVPDLLNDYEGIQTAHLFVAGDVLANNLSLEDMAKESTKRGIRVFFRNGKE